MGGAPTCPPVSMAASRRAASRRAWECDDGRMYPNPWDDLQGLVIARFTQWEFGASRSPNSAVAGPGDQAHPVVPPADVDADVELVMTGRRRAVPGSSPADCLELAALPDAVAGSADP